MISNKNEPIFCATVKEYIKNYHTIRFEVGMHEGDYFDNCKLYAKDDSWHYLIINIKILDCKIIEELFS